MARQSRPMAEMILWTGVVSRPDLVEMRGVLDRNSHRNPPDHFVGRISAADNRAEKQVHVYIRFGNDGVGPVHRPILARHIILYYTVNLDDQICYCYHVSLRKLMHFANREQPSVASQMSECLGAGTGCGWCIPILKRIHEHATRPQSGGEPDVASSLPVSPDEYAANRQTYIQTGQPRNQF